jgi:hypothetical protein
MADGEECPREEVAFGKKDDIWKWAKGNAIGSMDVSLGARECWRLLYSFPVDRCYPSHFWIAEKMHKSVSAVRRYLAELKQNGYIEITVQYDDDINRPGDRRFRSRKPRGQTSNRYTVLDQPDLITVAQQIVQDWYAKTQRSKD